MAEQQKPKEPPFYQPVSDGEIGYSNLDPENPGPLVEGDGIEGVIEKIDGRIITIKLDYVRCDNSGKAIKRGSPGYDIGHDRVRVNVPENFQNIFIFPEGGGKYEDYFTYVNFEYLQVGQRVGIGWERPAGSQEPLKFGDISISP